MKRSEKRIDDRVNHVYWALEPAVSPLALEHLATAIMEWRGEHGTDIPATVMCEMHNLENAIRNWLQHREMDSYQRAVEKRPSRMAEPKEDEIDELLR